MTYTECVVCNLLFNHQIKCTVGFKKETARDILRFSYCKKKRSKTNMVFCFVLQQTSHKNVALLAITKKKEKKTYHFEVLCSALGAVEVAGEEHVVDVVPGAVVEFPHVEGSWLEIVEIGFDL